MALMLTVIYIDAYDTHDKDFDFTWLKINTKTHF